MFKKFMERWRIRKALGRYAAPEAPDGILDGSFDPLRTTRKEIGVAFVSLTAADAKACSKIAGSVAELAMENEGRMGGLLPVAAIYFDGSTHAEAESRLAFVAAVRARFPREAAIVHGPVLADIGNFGSPSFMDFNFWWPGEMDAVRQLGSLRPGEAAEFREDGKRGR